MTEKPRWRCPECGRDFRTRNQWHSCVTHTVESHFAGKPSDVREAFDRLVAELERLGPFRAEAVMTSINLAGRAHFGSVRPVKDGLNVAFVLSRRLDHPRVLRTEQVTPALFGHRVKIRSAEEIDDELLGWLAEAYAFKGRPDE